MKSADGGYTLIEVLMFLAISSVLLSYAFIAVRGQSAHTEFTTSTNNVDSKLNQWFGDVLNGFSNNPNTPALSSFECLIDGATQRPKLQTGTKARGTNPNCVFLGKVIQFNKDEPGNNQIVAYTVVGRRTVTSGSEKLPVANLRESSPVAAVFDNDSDGAYEIDLTEIYQIPNGVRVTSVRDTVNPPCTAASVNCSRLGGFFTSFNNNGNQSGTASLLTVQFPFVDDVEPRNQDVLDCINLTFNPWCRPNGSTPGNLWPMDEWKICLENSRNDDVSQLTIKSNNGVGVSTELKSGKKSESICT